MGAWRHGGRVFVRFSGFRGRQSADRPLDGSRWSPRRDGTRRRADGRRAVAGAADDAALAFVSDDRRDGRGGKRLPRLFRPIAVPAELVHSPARPGDWARFRRRRDWLDDAIAVGAAYDRADRLGEPPPRGGGSWGG